MKAKRLKFKFTFKLNREYGTLIAMMLIGVLLAILFTSIFKGLFKLSTWNDIREILEVFMSPDF